MVSLPRTQPAEVRRSCILDSAQKLLLETPADELTIEKITTAAHVAKGTFYLYFKSKGDLIEALRSRLADQILAYHGRSLGTVSIAEHAVRMDTWFRDAIENRVSQEALHDALFHHHPAEHGSASTRRHIAMLAGLLEGGCRAGDFELVDGNILATLLYYAMHGAVDDLLHHGASESEPVILAVQDLARRAVGVAPANGFAARAELD